MAEEKSIIILSGPVGAGKTTVAHKFIDAYSSPIVYIEGDTFWSFFLKTSKSHSRHKNFKIIMRSMTLASIPFVREGYDVLLDFSIPPWFLDTARAIVKNREVPIDYVVLRPAETVCAFRGASRLEGRIADYSYYHDLYTSFDEAEQYIIQNDEAYSASIVSLIQQGLQEGRFRLT